MGMVGWGWLDGDGWMRMVGWGMVGWGWLDRDGWIGMVG